MKKSSSPRESSPSIDELVRDRRSGRFPTNEDPKKTSMNTNKGDREIRIFYDNLTAVIRNAMEWCFPMNYMNSEIKESYAKVGYLKERLEKNEDAPEKIEFLEKELKSEQRNISNECIKSHDVAVNATKAMIKNDMNSNRDELAKFYDSKFEHEKNMKNAKRKTSGTKPLRILEPILPAVILTFLSTRYENMKVGLGSWLSLMTSVGYSLPEAMVAGVLSASLGYLFWKWRMWTYVPFREKSWVPTASSGSLVLPRARFAITDRISKIVTRTVYSLCGAYVTLLAAGPIVVDLATYL